MWLSFVKNAGIRQVQVQVLREDVNTHVSRYRVLDMAPLVARVCIKAFWSFEEFPCPSRGAREGKFKDGSPMHWQPITNQVRRSSVTTDSFWGALCCDHVVVHVKSEASPNTRTKQGTNTVCTVHPLRSNYSSVFRSLLMISSLLHHWGSCWCKTENNTHTHHHETYWGHTRKTGTCRILFSITFTHCRLTFMSALAFVLK